MWLRTGQRVSVETDERLTKLALLAPPTGFFRAPSSLRTIQIPIEVWIGSVDDVTPPSQSEWLAQQLKNQQIVNIHMTQSAGHFSFMDKMPPNVIEPLQDKQAFLRQYSSAICRFAHDQKVA